MRRIQALSGLVAVVVWSEACVPEPPTLEVLWVEPERATAGETTVVAVHGRNFHPIVRGNLSAPNKATLEADFTLTLRSTVYAGELVEVTFVDPERLSATVPPDVPAGMYSLEVTGPRGHTASLVEAIEVRSVDPVECVPIGPETCNGVDDDCDGVIDGVGANGCTVYYADADDDGRGDPNQSRCLCAARDPYRVATPDDCSDSDADNWASCASCVDADGDGWYVGCDAYATSRQGPDCDDAPTQCGNLCSGALEESLDRGNCADGRDNDCDGGIDGMDSGCHRTFDADPGWTSFNLPLGANDYGWSATSNAGGGIGEIGGAFQRQLTGAYYADTSITSVSSSTPFAIGGRLSITREDASFDRDFLVGYFNADQAEVDNSFVCGMVLNEDWGEGPRVAGILGQTETIKFPVPGLGEQRFWSFVYDPDAGTHGEITFSVSGPGGRSETVALGADDRARLDQVTAFGLYGPGRPDPSAGVMEVFVDDLYYAP